MPDTEGQKRRAALHAAAQVRDGMVVGLGTGSTAALVVSEIGRRILEDGLQLTAVATSTATGLRAVACGIPLRPMGEISVLDLAIDGADEIDGRLRAIKGGGGALFREKIVAGAARRMIVVVDSSKPVDTLGKFALPVEVHPSALAAVGQRLNQYGVPVRLRMRADGRPFTTDQQANIFDVGFGVIADPENLALELQSIPGILCHGLFIDLIQEAVVGFDEGVKVISRPV